MSKLYNFEKKEVKGQNIDSQAKQTSRFNFLSNINYGGDTSRGNQQLTETELKELDGNPSVSNIIKEFNDLKPAHFLYSAGVGKYPTNRLVTLRRFAQPVHDLLPPMNVVPPLSTMVTFIRNDAESILPDLSTSLNWEETSGSQSIFPEIPILGKFNSVAQNFDSDFLSRVLSNSNFAAENIDQQSKTEELLGPINVVDKVNLRAKGQNADIEFKYTFKYEMKWVEGVDPKIALLDAFANAFVMCYDKLRFFTDKNGQYAFENVQTVSDYDFNFLIKNLFNSIVEGVQGIIPKIKNSFNEANLGESILEGDGDNILNFVIDNVGSALGITRFGREFIKKIYKSYTTLSGVPTGFWHLTIGNPFQPIVMWGNLICTNATFKWNKTLGYKDFPSGFQMEITLKPARDLDRDEITSKFNFAEGGIYLPPNAGNTSTRSPEVTDDIREGFPIGTTDETIQQTLDSLYIRKNI